MVDITGLGLFLLGALGAVLTVYVGQKTPIPKFRPLLDVSDMKREVMEIKRFLRNQAIRIEEDEAKLEQEKLDEKYAERLKAALDSRHKKRDSRRRRQRELEEQVRKTELRSAGLGVVLYIVLGGAFAWLLAGRVEVAGLSGDLPEFFAAIAIGATWTSYLSVVGFRSASEKTAEELDGQRDEYDKKLESLKKEIMERTATAVGKAEQRDKVTEPIQADREARWVAKAFDVTREEFKEVHNLTKQMVQSRY